MDAFRNKLVGIGSGVALLLQVPYFVTWIPVLLFGFRDSERAKGLFFFVTIAFLILCIWNSMKCIQKDAKLAGIIGLVTGLSGIVLTVVIWLGLSGVFG